MQNRGNVTGSTPPYEGVETVNTTVARTGDAVPARPVDLVRWGPIIAGIFAALATLITLTVLGLAVGASTYTPGANLGNLGIGAGIWAGISVLIAFFVGGLIAARSAAVSGTGNGILNGAMVWFVAIPLLIYVLGNGVGSLVGTAGNLAGGAVQAGASTAGQVGTAVAGNPTAMATAATAVAGGLQGAQATAVAAATAVNVTPAGVASTTGNTAWGVLLSLGLAAAAAILGGWLGARPMPMGPVTVRQTTTRT